jgi:hypothetical protein
MLTDNLWKRHHFMNRTYNTPNEWYQNHKSQLRQYRGQWIAFTKEGIIAHHQSLKTMMANLGPYTDYVIERIFENEFIEPLKLLPVRFRSIKKHEWQPKYEVLLTFKQAITVKMLVDSGADFSVISKELGITLGYTQAPGEALHQAQGIGGNVDYVPMQNLFGI